MMGWSMKKDCDLIQLALANLSAEQIAPRMKSGPQRVLKVAKRLGIHLPPIVPKQRGGLKANGK